MHKYTDTEYMKLICDTLDEIDIQSIFNSEYKCIRLQTWKSREWERGKMWYTFTRYNRYRDTHTITKGKQRQLKQVTLLLKLN